METEEIVNIEDFEPQTKPVKKKKGPPSGPDGKFVKYKEKLAPGYIKKVPNREELGLGKRGVIPKALTLKLPPKELIKIGGMISFLLALQTLAELALRIWFNL